MELFHPRSAAPIGVTAENMAGEIYGPDTDVYEVGHNIDPQDAIEGNPDDYGILDEHALLVRLLGEVRTRALGATAWSSQLYTIGTEPKRIAAANKLRTTLLLVNMGTDYLAIGPDETVNVLGNGRLQVNSSLTLPLSAVVWAVANSAGQKITVFEFFHA